MKETQTTRLHRADFWVFGIIIAIVGTVGRNGKRSQVVVIFQQGTFAGQSILKGNIY